MGWKCKLTVMGLHLFLAFLWLLICSPSSLIRRAKEEFDASLDGGFLRIFPDSHTWAVYG